MTARVRVRVRPAYTYRRLGGYHGSLIGDMVWAVLSVCWWSLLVCWWLIYAAGVIYWQAARWLWRVARPWALARVARAQAAKAEERAAVEAEAAEAARHLPGPPTVPEMWLPALNKPDEAMVPPRAR